MENKFTVHREVGEDAKTYYVIKQGEMSLLLDQTEAIEVLIELNTELLAQYNEDNNITPEKT